jgi:hypothetical protein
VDVGFLNIEVLYQDVMLGETCCHFQLTVVDITIGIIEGHQVALNAFGKASSSHEWLYGAIQLMHKLNASHAHVSSILCSQSVLSFLWDDLCDTGRPVCQVSGKPPKI